MGMFLEMGYTSLNKVSEELCGDKVESIVNGDFITVVLADGMGSGVKANILSTLTSKILCTMIANNVDIKECIETVIQSLPICKVRGMAYSTFSVIHINKSGKGYLFEFDNPEAIYIHDGKCIDLIRVQYNILGKKVTWAELNLCENDALIIMSDGVIHAGIGQTLNFGWERKEVMDYIEMIVSRETTARSLACSIASACNDLYLDKPGDDTTVAAIKIRKALDVNIMVGPPIHKEQDDFFISQFLSGTGKKVVCGGTSSQIVARHLNKEVTASFDFPDREVPPIGYIDGIDLTTEGVLTLRKLYELSKNYISVSDLTPKEFAKKDGASLLAKILFEEASDIVFFVGQGINKAHQGLPIDITMKLKLVEKLAANLKIMGKNVVVNYD